MDIKRGNADTAILRNAGNVMYGPVFSLLFAIALMSFSGVACDADKTNPYTKAMILVSGVSGLTQVFRLGLGRRSPYDKVRGGLNAAANGVSSAMLLAGAQNSLTTVDRGQILPRGRLGSAYVPTEVKAVGGDYVFNKPRKNWAVVGEGKLPAGLHLDPVTGVTSGTPTAPGAAVFTVQCSDSYGPPQYAEPTTLTIYVES